jgi:hypothetical protein
MFVTYGAEIAAARAASAYVRVLETSRLDKRDGGDKFASRERL